MEGLGSWAPGWGPTDVWGPVLGYVAEDYHLNLLAYLLDNASTYQCDAEVDNTQGTVNDDDLMDIKITVSLT